MQRAIIDHEAGTITFPGVYGMAGACKLAAHNVNRKMVAFHVKGFWKQDGEYPKEWVPEHIIIWEYQSSVMDSDPQGKPRTTLCGEKWMPLMAFPIKPVRGGLVP